MDIQHMIFLNPKVLVAIREIHILKNDFSLTHHQENYYKKAERIPSYEKENCGHHRCFQRNREKIRGIVRTLGYV